jgi:hypothetical protein
MVATATLRAVSMTESVLEPLLATRSRARDGIRARATGLCPTGMVWTTWKLDDAITDTLPRAVFAT